MLADTRLARRLIASSGRWVAEADFRSSVDDLITASSRLLALQGSDQRSDWQIDFVGAVRPSVHPPMKRVGSSRDGGYVMVDCSLPGTAISLGAGYDISWDVAVASQGTFVTIFDPYVRLSRMPSGIRFVRLGVGEGHRKLRTLDQLVDHAVKSNDGNGDYVLKIDVEGAEWAALKNWSEESRLRCEQLLVEFHFNGLPRDRDSIVATSTILQGLLETHVVVNVHANNFLPIANFDGFWIPLAFEVSYLRKDLVSPTWLNKSASPPATETLNAPCRIGPDIDLSGWL